MIKVYLALITVGLIYGANYTIAKSLMPGFIGPNAFILLRVLGGFLFFWLLQSTVVKERVKSRRDFLHLAICGFFGVAANMLMFFNGLQLTSPVNSSVIMTVNPLLVLFFSALLLKERVKGIKVLGIAIGMTGAILQIVDPFKLGAAVDGVNWKGDLLILGNASSYAAYLVLVKPLMARYHALTVVKWTFTFGLLMVLPFGLISLGEVEWSALNFDIGWRLAFVILATTIVAYLLNAWSLKHVSSTVVGAFIYLQPIFASAIAIWFANYEASWQMLLYAALIFTGVYLVSFGKGKNQTASA